MFSSAPITAREGGPVPNLIWLGAVGGLCLFAALVFYYFSPVLTVFGVTWALAAGSARTRADAPTTFFVATGAASFVLLALIAAFGEKQQEPRDANPFGSPHSHFRSEPDYLPSIEPWFDVKASDTSWVPRSFHIDEDKQLNVSGDILIQASGFERSTTDRTRLKCDARCRALLRQPEVTSVTIIPTQPSLSHGPRALMTDIRPEPQTFKVNQTEECRAAWYSPRPLRQERSGMTDDVSLLALRKLGRRCLMSSSAIEDFGAELTNKDLKLTY